MDDTCNPHVLRRFLPCDPEFLPQLQQSLPGITFCVRTLHNVAASLQTAMASTPMRVPLHVLAAWTPPGATYRRHLDSYGGRDNPRLLTILLYISWEPRTGGALRLYPPSPSTSKHARGAPPPPPPPTQTPTSPRDIEPVPGRVVIFFAQEMEHEVLPSDGERTALTQWVWDVERDDLGR